MNEKQVRIGSVLTEEDEKKKKQLYNQYVSQVTPKFSPGKNLLYAFVSGGAICLIGQAINDLFQKLGAEEKDAAAYGMLVLILLSVITTGLGWYARFAKTAGAGSLVPITGFANAVSAPAVEYRTEGQVYGIGCKIFTIAGPVILYGVFSSWVLGILYWVIKTIAKGG